MDFNGFANSDFDFFKKKDKMSKVDYEEGRKNLKTHFRGLCYEIQKLYYKEHSVPFYIEKEFQNFSKRSTSINAMHNVENSSTKLNLLLNEEGIYNIIEFSNETLVINILNEKRKDIIGFITGSRNRLINADLNLKSKNKSIIKLNSYEMSDKNFDNLYTNLSESIKNGKEVSFYIGYFYSKSECVKQGKDFLNTAYNSVLELLKFSNKLE
jgi:hypothetical protein